MLTKKIEEALNAQIKAEMWSANLYLSMSAYFYGQGLPGFASWMKVQYLEEKDHALKFFEYIVDRGGKVEMTAIDEVPTSWDSPLATFESTQKHEQIVSALIGNLMEIAIAEKDHATQSMLKWYIDEQVEEEKNAQTILDGLRMIKDNGYGLYMLDKELATRTYTPITTITPA
jgi:ferritin